MDEEEDATHWPPGGCWAVIWRLGDSCKAVAERMRRQRRQNEESVALVAADDTTNGAWGPPGASDLTGYQLLPSGGDAPETLEDAMREFVEGSDAEALQRAFEMVATKDEKQE